MSTLSRAGLLLVLFSGSVAPVAAQPPNAAELAAGRSLELAAGASADRQILVTFDDPHGGRIDLSGAPGPRYRRGTEYRVSANVRQAGRRLAAELGLDVVDEWPIRPLGVYCLVYRVPRARDVEALLETLRERPDVRSVQRMNVFETQSAARVHYDDPYAELQHALEALQVPEAHVWSRGEDVAVAVIDTGADLLHPDLRTQPVKVHDFVGAAGGRAARASDDRHGTAIAGVIAAAAGNGIGVVGVAPAARLEVLRACWHASPGEPAVCTSLTLARALSHAIESGAEIINLSLAGPADPLLSELLDVALRADVIVVAARPPDAHAGFPAGVPGVIVVDVPDADGRAAKANGGVAKGEGAFVRAPGRDILVIAPNADYELASGTSLAAAHVTGVIALLKAGRRSSSNMRLIDLLRESAGDDRPGNGGAVNACRALAALLERAGSCRDAGPAMTRLEQDERGTTEPL